MHKENVYFFPLNSSVLRPLSTKALALACPAAEALGGVAPALLVLQQLQSLHAVAARGARAQLRHRLPLQVQGGHRVGAIGRAWEHRFTSELT